MKHRFVPDNKQDYKRGPGQVLEAHFSPEVRRDSINPNPLGINEIDIKQDFKCKLSK